jgi:hypothetical protein
MAEKFEKRGPEEGRLPAGGLPRRPLSVLRVVTLLEGLPWRRSMGRKAEVRIEKDCPECHGSGEVLATIALSGQPPSLRWITCPECEGRGTVRSVHEVDEGDLEVEEG